MRPYFISRKSRFFCRASTLALSNPLPSSIARPHLPPRGYFLQQLHQRNALHSRTQTQTPNAFPRLHLKPHALSTQRYFSRRQRRADRLKLRPLSVALVGRPNVGKSTLFNRLVKRAEAIVSDIPGTTRDRREGVAQLGLLELNVTDTGGFEDVKQYEESYISGRHGPELLESMLEQTGVAVRGSDVVLFVVDAQSGILPEDVHFASWLRKEGLRGGESDPHVVVLANKAEGHGMGHVWGDSGSEGDAQWEALLRDCNRIGFGEPLAFSAEQLQGLGDLYDVLEPLAVVEEGEDVDINKQGHGGTNSTPESEDKVQVAMIGRPNVGKSTLVNTLIGKERVITGPIAGLTRDSITVEWAFRGKRIVLADTAGIRKSSRLGAMTSPVAKMKSGTPARAKQNDAELEQLSIFSSLKVLDHSQVIVFIIDVTATIDDPDANGPFTKHDLSIIGKIVEEGRAFVIAANKSDLAKGKGIQSNLDVIQAASEQVASSIPNGKGVPVVPISALKKTGVDELMEAVLDTYERWNMRVATSKLNEWLYMATHENPPPAFRGTGAAKYKSTKLKLKFMAQVGIRPPTFMISLNRRKPNEKTVPESYIRYLQNRLRRDFGFEGVPIRIVFRGSTGARV